jgi:GDP-4-dehydro-6-deoxy-D-mannose reductase
VKSLITGIAGFAGSHLAEHLLAQGHEVCGIVMPGESVENVSHFLDQITLHEGDILQPKQLQDIISSEQPDWVFHLAAMSSVSTAWNDPALAFEVNVTGGIHLIEACLPLKNQIRVVLITSAEIFGNHQASGQSAEADSYAPQNPYAPLKIPTR